MPGEDRVLPNILPNALDRDEGDLAALASFSTRLDEFDATLSPQDKALLDAVLYRAMSPLERIRHREETGLLDPDEQAMVDQLASETGD